MARHGLRVYRATDRPKADESLFLRTGTDRQKTMAWPEDHPMPESGSGAQFAATSWTNVLAAQRGGSPEAGVALEKLCHTYWYPLYAYIRRKGYDPHKAQDLTPEFFYRLIKENYLGAVDRRRGKFRSFLLAALNHFLSNQRDYERAAKR